MARCKDEKGKGGFWRLALNAVKSERKRIRSRKRPSTKNGTDRSTVRSNVVAPPRFKVKAQQKNKIIQKPQPVEQPFASPNDQLQLDNAVASLTAFQDSNNMLYDVSHQQCDEYDYDTTTLMNDGSNQVGQANRHQI